MSVEILEDLMEQTEKLSPQEKRVLARRLFESAERSSESDLGLSAESREEKRLLRDRWMKANREKYGGIYVALDGDKLVGTGKNYAEAVAKAKNAGIPDAVVDIVLPPDFVGEIGGFE